MLKKVLFIGVFVIFSCLLLESIAEAQNIKEGLWEVTIRVEMPGMPMQMPAQTITQCLTKKDITPTSEELPAECKITQSNVKGNLVTWAIECDTDEGLMVSAGSFTYQGDTFEGKVSVQHAGMDMLQIHSGKRIGECD